MRYLIANYEIENVPSSTMKNLLDYIRDKKVIGIDTETVRLGDSILDNKVVIFQIGDLHNQWVIDTRVVDIKPLFKVLKSNSVVKVGHNIKFDYQVIRNTFDVSLENVFDTMVMEYLFNAGKSTPKRGFYTLESALYRHTGLSPYGDQLSFFDPWIPKKERTEIPKRERLDYSGFTYCAVDVESAMRVYHIQSSLLKELKMEKAANLENLFVPVLGDMELAGMPLNVDRWVELDEWSGKQAEIYLKKIQEQYPEVLNWNAPQQVARLFKKLGINVRTKDKKKSVGREVVFKDSVQEDVIAEQAEAFPIIKDYLKWKGLAGINSKYGIKFLRHLDSRTNRLHTNFIQVLNTGRTSSSGPNMQNIVSASDDFEEGVWWREAFEAPKGRVFVIADYSGQEMRIAAHKSQDKNMIDAYERNVDMHKLAASHLFQKNIEDVTSMERKQGKNLNFATLYGAGPSKIATAFKVSQAKAKKLLANYFAGFPKLKVLQEASYKFALSNGYIKIDKLGRRAFIDLEKYDYLRRTRGFEKELSILEGIIFREAANYIIQGTGASMSKLAGILIRNEIKHLDAKIVLLIHDEWVIECAENVSEEVRTIVENCMLKAAKALCPSVPFAADAKILFNWNK